MKKENIIKVLIPLIAVIVVVESIVLVSNLDKYNAVTEVVSEEVTPTEEVSTPVADFIFETENKEMTVGKSYTVNLNLLGKSDVNLDAMELYVKYDPDMVTVSKLTFNKELPKTTSNSGIDAKSGLISSVFLWDIGESYSLKTDTANQVLSFTVTPKVEGDSEISLLTGATNQEMVTLMVESLTSKSLTFSGNQLEIKATK